MANYTYIGYDPSSLIFSGSTITLSGSYDPDLNRRIFDVEDDAGGNVRGGRPDAGIIFDGDRFNNEGGDDFDQTGDATSLDGSTVFASGNMYLEQSYTLTNPGGGTITVYRVEVDGTFVGHITSEPLEAGVTYSFTTSNVTPFNAPDTEDPTAIIDVPCFCAGTMIRTPTGDRPVETLQVGDLITLSSGESKPLRWIGHRLIEPSLARDQDLWPVRIKKGTFGRGLPHDDLLVSPNHRLLIASPNNELYFGEVEVLVAAKFLTDTAGVERETDLPQITYYHMLFEHHEIVVSNGMPSESLYPGDMTLRGMAADARDEILTLFPELANDALATYGPIAATTLRRYEAALVAPGY